MTGNYLQILIPVRVIYSVESPRETEAPIIFTGREQDFFSLLMQGRAHKEIAKILNISPRTSKWHAARIYKKCGVRDRTQLMAKFRGN